MGRNTPGPLGLEPPIINFGTLVVAKGQFNYEKRLQQRISGVPKILRVQLASQWKLKLKFIGNKYHGERKKNSLPQKSTREREGSRFAYLGESSKS